MSLGDAERRAAADELAAAYTSREPVEPLVARHPDMTLDDAYAVQTEQLRRRLEDGRVIWGHKVGLTSPAMQRQMKVDQPDFGYLLDDMFCAEHDEVPIDRFLQPRVEPEIAFLLKRDLMGPGVTVAQAASAVEFVLPAIEIIDSRIRDWRISIVDTIADNASSGGVVLGARAVPLDRFDLRLMGCVVTRAGRVLETGAGAAVLGNPLLGLAWLANTLGPRGRGLLAGEVVMPGSLTASIPVGPKDAITVEFAGLGNVTARFSGEPTA